MSHLTHDEQVQLLALYKNGANTEVDITQQFHIDYL